MMHNPSKRFILSFSLYLDNCLIEARFSSERFVFHALTSSFFPGCRKHVYDIDESGVFVDFRLMICPPCKDSICENTSALVLSKFFEHKALQRWKGWGSTFCPKIPILRCPNVKIEKGTGEPLGVGSKFDRGFWRNDLSFKAVWSFDEDDKEPLFLTPYGDARDVLPTSFFISPNIRMP